VGRSRRRFAVLYVSLRCLDFRLTLTATKAGNSMPRNNGGAMQVESCPCCQGQPSENPTTNGEQCRDPQRPSLLVFCGLYVCLRTCVYMHVTVHVPGSRQDDTRTAPIEKCAKALACAFTRPANSHDLPHTHRGFARGRARGKDEDVHE